MVSPARILAWSSLMLSVACTPAGWLGASMRRRAEADVRVEKVVRNSPADHAGLKAGDRVLAIDGMRVVGASDIAKALGAHARGDRVELSLDRDGSAIRTSVVLAAVPAREEILRMDLVGVAAPPWVDVTPLPGAPPSLDALGGRVVLLDFWASWCAPCRRAAPKLSALNDRFAARGLRIVGVTTDGATEAAEAAEHEHMTYPSVVDAHAATNLSYGISGLPTMVLIDRKGIVREVFLGLDDADEKRLVRAIEALVAEPVPNP